MSLADAFEQGILVLGLSGLSNGFVLGLVGCWRCFDFLFLLTSLSMVGCQDKIWVDQINAI